MSALAEIAAALEAMAKWIDDQLAIGAPPKWICHQAARATRDLAAIARGGDRGEVS